MEVDTDLILNNESNDMDKVVVSSVDDDSQTNTLPVEETIETSKDFIQISSDNNSERHTELTNETNIENNRNELTDYVSDKGQKTVNDDLTLQCFDCGVKKCVMWRKYNISNVLCSICHLKRVKNSGQSGLNMSQKNSSNQKNRTTELPVQRISKRKSKTNKKFTNSVYERIIKNGNSKNRRNLFKKKPVKAAEGVASIITSKSAYHNGLLYEIGDIVCTSDIEGGTFFAQLRGFLQDDFCEKSAVVTWLIPTVANLTKFDPMLFVPGLDEDHARSMDCFEFVCRAPTNLFKSRYSHPPFLRVQSNLDSLIVAAKCIDDDGQASEDNIESTYTNKTIAENETLSLQSTDASSEKIEDKA